MQELAAPYSPIVYFLHTIIGTLGVLLAFVALAQQKGNTAHRRSGWGFTIAAGVAAVTAIVFSTTEPSPLSIASSLMVLGLVWGAVLALRPLSGRVRAAEWGATVLVTLSWLILVLVGTFGILIVAGIAPAPPGVEKPPLWVVMMPVLYAFFPTYFLIDDRRFRRRGGDRRPVAFTRHLSRMAFALAIAVHAPIVSFADDLGLNPMLAFFGPFIIWPIVLYATRQPPLRLRRDTASA